MNRFRLAERIGSGGMGTVYRAFDERLQREVAIKEVRIHDDGARVRREAQAAARLNHPAIVALYELGIDHDRALLVSELVHGATLDRLAREGDLSDREVAEVGIDVCAALEHAHERGVIHRDIKPQNVILRADEGAGRIAKLMDFGIAHLAGSPTLTASGEVVGTLAYMAPEQAEGTPAGPTADVYSLALTLFCAWAGENPVAARTPALTARRIGTEVPSLAEFRPDLPARLTDTVDACLDPDPALRPQVADLSEELAAVTADLDAAQPVPTPVGDPEPQPERNSSRTGYAAAFALLAFGGVVLAGPAGRPGLAVVAALLLAPSLLLASAPARGLLPALAPGLGALLLAPLYPAAAALEPRLAGRAAFGALGWCWLAAAVAFTGLPGDPGFADPASAGWEQSASAAADSLLAALLAPESLLGAGLFALAAVAFGALLSARHAAVSVAAALLWAACLCGALSVIGDGSLGEHPALIALGALGAVIITRRSPSPAAPTAHLRVPARPLPSA